MPSSPKWGPYPIRSFDICGTIDSSGGLQCLLRLFGKEKEKFISQGHSGSYTAARLPPTKPEADAPNRSACHLKLHLPARGSIDIRLAASCRTQPFKMRFGKMLRDAVHAPWKDKYIDYRKLKTLLREDKFDDDSEPWTEEDENRFCDEIFNVELEKVATFQQQQFDTLKNRVDAAFGKLKELSPATTTADDETAAPLEEADKARLRELEKELDAITNEVKVLKKYSSINYTGFLKIVKKHDRKRGDNYKVRPIMQLSLAQRPFNSEQGYSPLLEKLSIMYFAIHQHLEGGAAEQVALDLDPNSHGETQNGERYAAAKCKSLIPRLFVNEFR